jgi:hypothetical protein
MPKPDEQKTEQTLTMPRREFIRKSIAASGGLFVGMSMLGKVPLPELATSNNPHKPSSGKKEDKPGKNDKKDRPVWSRRG